MTNQAKQNLVKKINEKYRDKKSFEFYYPGHIVGYEDIYTIRLLPYSYHHLIKYSYDKLF